MTDDQRSMNAYRLGELEAEKARREKAKAARAAVVHRNPVVKPDPVIAPITKSEPALSKPAQQPAQETATGTTP